MTDKPRGKSPQNPKETWRFRRGEFKCHRFVGLRVVGREEHKQPVPNKKGLAVAPHLWPEFRKHPGQVETALVQAGWPEEEKLTL